jgi:hypothetical protein
VGPLSFNAGVALARRRRAHCGVFAALPWCVGCRRRGARRFLDETHLGVLFDATRRHCDQWAALCAAAASQKMSTLPSLGHRAGSCCRRPIPCRVSVWTSGSKATTFCTVPLCLLVSHLPLALSLPVDASNVLHIADVGVGRLERHSRRPALGTLPRRDAWTREAPHSSPSHRC